MSSFHDHPFSAQVVYEKGFDTQEEADEYVEKEKERLKAERVDNVHVSVWAFSGS